MKEWHEPKILSLGVENTAEGDLTLGQLTDEMMKHKYGGNGDDKYLLDSEENAWEKWNDVNKTYSS